jgi:DNA integrity scanning protein DisA with diadenylate cyclase activity
MAPKRTLLSIIELGGYPNFVPLYERLGYDVVSVVSVRKALSALKKVTPQVIVAEFNYQSDFRDRTSSLESLLAAVQRSSGIRVVVFYEPEYSHQLDRLRARFPMYETLPHPIQPVRLEDCLRRLADEEGREPTSSLG